jgi:hypothetical protein
MSFSKRATSLNQPNQLLRTAETIMTVIGMTEATEIGEVDSVQTRKGGTEVVLETTVDVAEAEDIDIRLYFYWYVVCNIAWLCHCLPPLFPLLQLSIPFLPTTGALLLNFVILFLEILATLLVS